MAAMNINSKKLKEMIESGKTFLVDFWAPWCPHCRKINPAYEQIAEQYADKLEVVKLDMDEDGGGCLKMKIKKWIRPALFTLGGALAGLAYDHFIGCASGSCPITSNPFGSMLYMGLIGYLVSGIFSKECGIDMITN